MNEQGLTPAAARPKDGAGRRLCAYALATLAALSLLLSYQELRPADSVGMSIGNDSWDYLSIAQNLYEGKGYRITKGTTFISQNPTSYRTPGYPYFILAFEHLFGMERAVTAVVLYQHFLLAFLPILFFALARATGAGRSSALFAALMAFLFFPFRSMAGMIHPEFLAVVLLVAALWCLLSYLDEQRFWKMLGFGVLLAAAILVKQNLVALGILYVYPLPRLTKRRDYAASLAIVVVAILGWVARNALVQGVVPVFTTNGGLNFYLANNPELASDSGNIRQLDDAMNRLMGEGLSETAADRKLYRMGMKEAFDNGLWWQAKRVAAKAAVMFRDYYPPIRNEAFFLLLPFALAATRRRLLLGLLIGFQVLYGSWAYAGSPDLLRIYQGCSLDVAALHLMGTIALILLLRGGDAKARCLLAVYVLIQILGLIYIPIDRESVIADSVLILAYAMSPPVLRELYSPRHAPAS